MLYHAPALRKLLALGLLCFGFCACGQTGDLVDPADKPSSEEDQAPPFSAND
ncbi:hypothetical protein [Agaribacterium sp. ZY112]|uniref:hypothetical protein n=1 Tax=Agaribacterium sp. ZY112 TaxID=3233574 RepID=UPI003525244B